ncbi:hypothetical protein C0J52_15554, partial [Blattella germanica]
MRKFSFFSLQRMVDTSDHTIEERWVAAVWVHERQINSNCWIEFSTSAQCPRLSLLGASRTLPVKIFLFSHSNNVFFVGAAFTNRA